MAFWKWSMNEVSFQIWGNNFYWNDFYIYMFHLTFIPTNILYHHHLSVETFLMTRKSFFKNINLDPQCSFSFSFTYSVKCQPSFYCWLSLWHKVWQWNYSIKNICCPPPSGPKSRGTVPKLDKSIKRYKSLSKILTNWNPWSPYQTKKSSE